MSMKDQCIHLVSRKDAKSNGLKTYFTGKPCKHGHVDLRYTDNLTCSECIRVKRKKHYENNREQCNEQSRKTREKYSDRYKMKQKEYRDNPKNKKKISEHKKKWAEDNAEFLIGYRRRYYLENKDDFIRRARERSRKIRNQGIKEFYQKEINDIYKNRPEGYHVDHIVPIQGNDVSGLHVPWNMQYLPESINTSKRNYFNACEYDEEYPYHEQGIKPEVANV